MPATRLLPGGPRTSWAGKRCRCLSISDRGWELLTSYAQDAGLNRSEWLERCLRQLSPEDAAELPQSAGRPSPKADGLAYDLPENGTDA